MEKKKIISIIMQVIKIRGINFDWQIKKKEEKKKK